MRRSSFLGALLLLSLSGARASDSFTISPRVGEIEGRELSAHARFARIDSLRATTTTGGIEEVERLRRLAELHLATGMIEHRRHALDLLDAAADRAPADRRVRRLRAWLAGSMGYPGAAGEYWERNVREAPGDARALTDLGSHHFANGRGRGDTRRLSLGRDAFAAAIAADSSHVDAWYGLAVCALELRDPEAAASAARRARELGDGARARFVEGAARVALADWAGADEAFAAALDSSPDTLRAAFEGATFLLDARALAGLAKDVLAEAEARELLARAGKGVDPLEDPEWRDLANDPPSRALTLDRFWQAQDPRPAQAFNPRRLEFYRRMVLADLRHGSAEERRRGWRTPMGQVLLWLGEPTSVHRDAGGFGSVLDDLEAAGARLPIGERVPSATPLTVWTYRWPGDWFSLLFTDPSRNGRWTLADRSAFVSEGRRREDPIRFPPSTEGAALVRMGVGHAVFPRQDGRAVLETYVEVPAAPITATAGDGVRLQWSLFERGERVDSVELALDEAHRLSRLTDRARPAEREAWVYTVGARVEPGREHRIGLELLSARGTVLAQEVFDAVVEEVGSPVLLELSDLQLARVLRPLVAGEQMPSRFVKFGWVVVPAVEGRFERGTGELAIYFEARNLATDAAGRTSFDVRYEVFPRAAAARAGVSARGFRRVDLDGLEPLSLTFLEETTGVSPEGLVVKGTRLDLTSLDAGAYALVVTLHDRIARRESSRATVFRLR